MLISESSFTFQLNVVPKYLNFYTLTSIVYSGIKLGCDSSSSLFVTAIFVFLVQFHAVLRAFSDGRVEHGLKVFFAERHQYRRKKTFYSKTDRASIFTRKHKHYI